ncbi:MAG: hypothetical protein AAGE18_10125 [Pseudomonadota bacterium]
MRRRSVAEAGEDPPGGLAEAEIARLVDAEIARRRAAGLLDPAPKTSAFGRLTRHPLTVAFVAFALTTLLGGWYDGILKNRAERAARLERDIARIQAEEQEAAAKLSAFITLVNERSIRSDLLRSAIVRGAAEEARERKRAYDDVYLRWNVAYPLQIRVLRGLLGEEGQTIYERAVAEAIAPLFAKTDACLTAAFDLATARGFQIGAGFRPAGCSPEGRWTDLPRTSTVAVRECANAILTNMRGQIAGRALRRQGNAAGEPPPERRDWAASIEAELLASCPGLAPSVPA